MSSRFAHTALLSTLLGIAACAPPSSDPTADDTAGNESALAGTVNAGTVLRVTASSLNLRKTASTSASVIEVLSKGDLVTVVAKSGANGWVHVSSDNGGDGWVARQYVVVDSSSPTNPTPSGSTCDPARATGAVNDYEKALHDSIAYAEGTRNYSKDGYNVLFSFKLIQSCETHPNQCLKFGSSCSTAAGRYQFLTKTWSSVKSAENLDSFEPENQERGAQYLVNTVRHVSVPSGRAMTASEFSNAMSKLSYEWASLPPGRYGQPNKSFSQMRTMYCSEAGC